MNQVRKSCLCTGLRLDAVLGRLNEYLRCFCNSERSKVRLGCFFSLHLHSPHISMQVMARAENTVFLRVEEKESNLEISVCMPSRRKKVSG